MGGFQAIKYVSMLVMIMLVIRGLYYVVNLKAELATSEANNVKLETAVSVQQKVIVQKAKEFEIIQGINEELTTQNAKLEQDVKNLNEKFNVSANGQSRDFGAITRVKPALIEKIINNATTKVNRCFEIASGSPLKEGEKNNECQELIDYINK